MDSPIQRPRPNRCKSLVELAGVFGALRITTGFRLCSRSWLLYCSANRPKKRLIENENKIKRRRTKKGWLESVCGLWGVDCLISRGSWWGSFGVEPRWLWGVEHHSGRGLWLWAALATKWDWLAGTRRGSQFIENFTTTEPTYKSESHSLTHTLMWGVVIHYYNSHTLAPRHQLNTLWLRGWICVWRFC